MEQEKNTDQPGIELRSEEVQDILGMTPAWIIRRGTTLLVVILFALLAGSWFFRYPDIVRADILITTENPPATVVAKATGKIESLFVTDTQKVAAGEHLAVIENPAGYESVLSLSDQLTRLSPFLKNFDTLLAIRFGNDLSLGEIQPDFTVFHKNYRGYTDFLRLDYHRRRIGAVRQEMDKYQVYYDRLYRQRNLLEREVELARKQFSRDSLLFQRNVIPMAEFERAESQRIGKEHDFEQAQINLSEVTIKISELEKEILDLRLKEREERTLLENGLVESSNNLLASVAAWEQKYLLRAPQGGIVSFTKYWSKDQNVTTGDVVITVVPENQGMIIGRMNLAQKRAGKVKPGQKVNIKLENYPYLEFGMVQGIVKSVSLVPNNDMFTAEIALPQGLVSNYGKELGFNQEMQGQAEIITESRPLLIRIMEPIRYIYEKNIRKEAGEVQSAK